jgi:small subunit ribosomal protein S29
MPPRTCVRRLSAAVDDATIFRVRSLHLCRVPCASFSTTTPRTATPPKKSKVAAYQSTMPKKGRKTLRIKKDAPPHDPTIGTAEERKAFKTRIVLSNTNANDVPGLQDLGIDTMFSPDSRGKVFKLPGAVVDSLRTVGAFKRGQGWNNYKKPSFLMTQEAWDIGQSMQKNSVASDVAKTLRKIVVGERKSGKSVLLLQAMTMAFLQGWVVINIPECKHLHRYQL